MSKEPRYAFGDTVRWTTQNGEPEGKILEVFEPGLREWQGGASSMRDFSYLVEFASRPPRVIGESVLEPIPFWVDCPGEHRRQGRGWQRRDM